MAENQIEEKDIDVNDDKKSKQEIFMEKLYEIYESVANKIGKLVLYAILVTVLGAGIFSLYDVISSPLKAKKISIQIILIQYKIKRIQILGMIWVYVMIKELEQKKMMF